MTLTTPAMLELIERLEKATGPDREIDADIFWLVLRPQAERAYWNGAVGKPGASPITKTGLGWRSVTLNAPRYSVSIDAALTLARDVEERKLMIVAMVNAFKNVDALDTFAWLKEAIIFALRARLSTGDKP